MSLLFIFINFQPEPPLAIIPLGTGNDLSRVLGWGKQNTPELDLPKILNNIQEAELVKLDR